MSYCSYVAAAIGGDSNKIRQFVDKIKLANLKDEFLILSDFKIVELEPNFSVFVYYNDYIKWYEEAETTWRSLRDLANQSNLSYIFYRLGEEPGDTEVDNNNEESYFDSRLEELFGFHHCIEINNVCETLT